MSIIEEIKAEILALQTAENNNPVLRLGEKRFLELAKALEELQHKKPNAVIFMAAPGWEDYDSVLVSGCPVILDGSKDEN